MGQFSNLSDNDLLDLARQQGISVDEGPQEDVDTQEGAPFGVRALASFKSDPTERLNYFKKALGDENVTTTEGGEIVWKNPKTNRWTAVDEAGFSLADIADFAGDIPELIGGGVGAVVGGAGGAIAGAPAGPAGIIGGVVGGGKLGAGVGSAAGNVVKQLISAALVPGEETFRPGSRLGEAATSGALGFAAQGLGNVITRGIGAWRGAKDVTQRGLSEAVRRSNDAELLRRGLELEQAIPESQLTPYQLTGNRIYGMIEGFARRNPLAGERWSAFDVEKAMRPVETRATRIMSQILDRPVGDETLGRALKETTETAVENALEHMNTQASRDFGLMRALGKEEPRITVDNFVRGLKEIISKYGSPLYGKQALSLSKEANQKLEYLFGKEFLQGYGGSRGGPALTPKKLQELMQFIGDSAYGKAPNLFDLPPKMPFAKELSQDLHTLLRYDLDIAAIAGQGRGAKILRQARANYEGNIKNLRSLQGTLISNYIKNMGEGAGMERVAQWLHRLTPSELQATINVLEPTDPAIKNMMQRNVLENAIRAGQETAEKGTVEYGIKKGRFSLRAFVESMPDREKSKILFGDTSEQLGKEIAEIIEFSERAGAIGRAGSIQEPTFRLAARLARNPTSLREIWHVMGPSISSEFFLNREGRKILLEAVKNPTPVTRKRAQDYIDRAIMAVIYETEKSMADQQRKNVPVQ